MRNFVRRRSQRGLVLVMLALILWVPTALAGGAPSLAWLSSPSGNFGTVANGSSTTNTYTLKNSGGSATGALSMSLTGASDFSISHDTCTATSLGPKKSCTLDVTYAPTTDGASDTATLTEMGKKPVATATLDLSGKTAAAAPTCTSGSENFSGFAVGSQPTTFAGGTIDTAYGSGGGVVGGGFLFGGYGAGPFTLTFAQAVGNLSLSASLSQLESDTDRFVTLTAYDASNVVLGSDTENSGLGIVGLSFGSAANDIKSFVVSSNTVGLSFGNISWGCN